MRGGPVITPGRYVRWVIRPSDNTPVTCRQVGGRGRSQGVSLGVGGGGY